MRPQLVQMFSEGDLPDLVYFSPIFTSLQAEPLCVQIEPGAMRSRTSHVGLYFPTVASMAA
jgi:hypothetical protein